MLERPKLTTAYTDWEEPVSRRRRLSAARRLATADRRDGQDRAGARKPSRRPVHRQRCRRDRGGRARAPRRSAAFDICPRAVHVARQAGCESRSRRRRSSRLMGACSRIRAVRPGGQQSALRSARPDRRRPATAVACRTAARMGRGLRRPTRARPALRVDAEPARRRRHDACSCSPSSPSRGRRWRRWPACGLDAEILAWQWIPFGPVLSARAQWLEDTGRLEPGRREEELVVIRADRA